MNSLGQNKNTNNITLKEDFENIVMEAIHDVFIDSPSNKEIFVTEVKDYLDDVNNKASLEGIEEGMNLLDKFYDFRFIIDEAMEGLMNMLMDLLQILIVKVRGKRNITGQYKFTYC